LTVASLLDDSPLDLDVGGGSTYRPRNYDERFRGLVTARTALASSLNIPAVRTLELVGVEDFWSMLRRLRLRNLEESEFYGPSLALGTVDVCLEDIVNAYRSIANAGVLTAAQLTPDAAPSQEVRVFSRESAFLVSDILSDRESRAATFGLENPLATRFWTAVKTGTSKDMRDNWCVGFSDSYTVGVWVGNFSGASMWNVSGVSGAAPVWLEIMNRLHRGRPSQPPSAPPGVARQRTEVPELGVDREEWFLRGTEPIKVEAIEERAGTRILYPPTGSLLAVDPDIPADSQVVLFEASSQRESMRWVLNGTPLAEDGRIVRWALAPGKHRLVLQDLAKKELDAVEFEVRGGPLPSTRDE
jgi:penicillin-binding protein 1C